MKDYIFTGLLILCVIIVGVGIYKVSTEESNFANNENVIAVVEEKNENEEIEEPQIENQETNVEENLETEEINQEETNIEEENDSSEIVSQEESILNQIANKFKECDARNEMVNQGYYMDIAVMGNEIVIHSGGVGVSVTQYMQLEDNILTSIIRKDLGTNEENVVKSILTTVLFDCVAQLKGYPERTLTLRLAEDESRYYTLENEGVEIGVDNGLIMKIDLNNNFDFLNN